MRGEEVEKACCATSKRRWSLKESSHGPGWKRI